MSNDPNKSKNTKKGRPKKDPADKKRITQKLSLNEHNLIEFIRFCHENPLNLLAELTERYNYKIKQHKERQEKIQYFEEERAKSLIFDENGYLKQSYYDEYDNEEENEDEEEELDYHPLSEYERAELLEEQKRAEMKAVADNIPDFPGDIPPPPPKPKK